MKKDFSQLASNEVIDVAKNALIVSGLEVLVVENGAEAKQKILEMISEGSEVMNMSSVTVDIIGLGEEINESGKYDSVRKKFAMMDKKVQELEMKKLGAAPEWVVGSVHAVTEDGKVIVASKTGSQLAAYVYGARRVAWIVGAQKIVKDLEEGMKRVYEYVLPLEDERARKAYGEGSSVNKLFILHKEVIQDRITMIIVKERLGF